MLVLDREGHVLSANREATSLVEAAGLDDEDLTCCELLGCRTPGTVLESACLTELALRREQALPEIRADRSTLARPAVARSSIWNAPLAMVWISCQQTSLATHDRCSPGACSRRTSSLFWSLLGVVVARALGACGR